MSNYGVYIISDYSSGATLCYIIDHSTVVLLGESRSGASGRFTVTKSNGGTVKISSTMSTAGAVTNLF